MLKPKPNFDMGDITRMLAQIQQAQVEQERDWFMVRDLEELWGMAGSSCRRRLLKMVVAGLVESVGDRIVANRLNPNRVGSVPAYRIVQQEGA